MELLHAPFATSPTVNLTFHNFHNNQYYPKPQFSSSETLSSSNSFKPTKVYSFLSLFSLTQQNSHVQFNSSIQKSSFSRTFTSSSTSTSTSTATPFNPNTSNSSENVHWMVLMDKPPQGIHTKSEIINYYVTTLAKAIGSEKDAQSCIYDTSCETFFGFCCVVDEQTSNSIAGLPGVLCVKPDPDINSVKKDYGSGNIQEDLTSNSSDESTLLFPNGSKNWLVRVENPSRRFSSKAQAVDSYVNILTKVLGNERDSQMCLYHVSWESTFGFCCKLDEESAQELASVSGVLSVLPDEHFESENKDYGGSRLSSNASESTQATDISKTKLFITGLSFYTSEKTLRTAFEPFGELVEVKVIMDKISKRSKGYAFVEYTDEDAATSALQEMNGKIINGWMIVVDRAKMKPRYSKERSRALSSRDKNVK